MRIYDPLILSQLKKRFSSGSVFLSAVTKSSIGDGKKIEDILLGNVEINDSDFLITKGFPFGSPKKLYLSDLIVHPSRRKEGIASHLLQTVERIGREKSYEEIYLHLQEKNKDREGEGRNKGGDEEKGEFSLLTFYERRGYRLLEWERNTKIFTEAHLQLSIKSCLFLMKSLK